MTLRTISSDSELEAQPSEAYEEALQDVRAEIVMRFGLDGLEFNDDNVWDLIEEVFEHGYIIGAIDVQNRWRLHDELEIENQYGDDW